MDQTISERLDLLCTILDEEHSLQELMDLGYDLFHNPLFVTDTTRLVLAHSQNVKIESDEWQSMIVRGERIKNTPQQSLEMKDIRREGSRTHSAHYVDDGYVPYGRLIKTILIQNHPAGDLVLSELCKPFAPEDRQLLGLFSVQVQKQMNREPFVTQFRSLGIENLIIKLLSGTQMSQKRLDTELDIVDWHPFRFFYLLAIPLDASLPEIEELLHITLTQSRWVAVVFDDMIVILLNRREPISHWADDEQEFVSAMRHRGFQTGISRAFQDLSRIREAFLEAGTALRLGTRIQPREYLHQYSLFSLCHVLENLPQGFDARRFCNEKIIWLDDYDTTEDKDLLVTLLSYLIHRKSLSQASEELIVHRNTIRYRIQKCMEIMHTDLEDSNENNAFIFSLQILRYLRSK